MRRLAACAVALASVLPGAALHARDVAASAPGDLSVTVYRAPGRNGGSIRLDALGGFAVITETRTVTLLAGESELRFEGVADGIVPESAIVSGLPGGVIEKNRNAALLSPSAVARAAVGRTLTLKRTDRRTGNTRLVPATLVSAGPDGVIFRTAAGTEAMQCSGLPETFAYSRGGTGLFARPTLSVKTSTARPITARVTLTYIAESFDWSANYTARISPDGKTMDLGGWITLANGNSVSLPDARTQIVAGGLNRAYVQRYLNAEPQVIARCWPMQSTSDIPLRPDRPYELVQPWMANAANATEYVVVTARRNKGVFEMAAPPAPVMAMPAPPPPPEQLGDLKLYRVPQRTTIAAQQMKQTRLLDQPGVPVERIYTLRLHAGNSQGEVTYPAIALLRTQNDKQHKLGLPLPAGSFVVEQEHGERAMLIGQPVLRDTAEGEKVELTLGTAPDVNVSRRTLRRSANPPIAEPTGLGSDLLALWRSGSSVEEIDLSNASDKPVRFELRLQLYGAQRIGHADLPVEKQDGQPMFRVEIPANGALRLHYTVEQN